MSSNLGNTQSLEESISLECTEIDRERTITSDQQTKTIELTPKSEEPLDTHQMPQSFRSNKQEVEANPSASDDLLRHVHEAVEKKRSSEEVLESVRFSEVRSSKFLRSSEPQLLVGTSILTRLMRYIERVLENIHDKIFALFNLQRKKTAKAPKEKGEASKEQSSEGVLELKGLRGFCA